MQSLALQREAEALVTPRLRQIARQARFLPPSAVWRDILILAWLALDEEPFRREPEPEDGEAPMP